MTPRNNFAFSTNYQNKYGSISQQKGTKSSQSHQLNNRILESQMVDVSKKQPTVRTAIAQSIIQLNKEAFDQVQQKQLSKGDALTMAEVAGIMAVKRTQDLIPLCHQIAVDFTRFKFYFDEIKLQIVVQVRFQRCEMEAMTGANIAALTIYDMCKPVYKGVEIINSKLLVKTGGKSGDYMNIKETERII